jgi:hypothetical protein
MGSGTVVPSATAFVTTPPCFRFHPVPESVVASKSVRVKAIAHLVSHSLPTHLTLFSYLAYRSREDPEEQVWNYSFKNNTGKVINRIGCQLDAAKGLRGRLWSDSTAAGVVDSQHGL